MTPALEELDHGAEKAILVGLVTRGESRERGEDLLEELAELVVSAGGVVVDAFLQERPDPDPALFMGRGKLAEVREAVLGWKADLVIFDDELTPAQQRNIEDFLETRVLDRSALILDIFAQRAQSREGKLQVELAQLEYLLPRLVGEGTELSRLGGGIGTRGPGETKLESDRRRVRNRIAKVRKELARLESRRALHRKKRQGIPMSTVSLVGYTNAGKSTLFNRLCREETFVSRRMFATLDPLVRKISLPSGQEALVSDTVGFIRKLPHSLVEAFQATLEETLEADVILHVIDRSEPAYEELRKAVYEVLGEIGVVDIPVLEVYNKMDRVENSPLPKTEYEFVEISAKEGWRIDSLLTQVEALVSRNYRRVRMIIPFEDGEVLSAVMERGLVEKTEYKSDGVHVRASLRAADIGRYQQYLEKA